MSSLTETIKSTGEVLEVEANTPDEIMQEWLRLTEYEKAVTKLKDKLKPAIRDMVDERGTYENGKYMFRVSAVQRQNYDKAVLRQVLDEDLLDLFLEPAKGKIDKYLADNLETLGEVSTQLRGALVAVGQPYTTVRLEKITR